MNWELQIGHTPTARFLSLGNLLTYLQWLSTQDEFLKEAMNDNTPITIKYRED